MFQTFRYSRVDGPEANQYPSLTWYFVVLKDKIRFSVSVCNPVDQFNRAGARELCKARYIHNEFFQGDYNPHVSLVENGIDILELRYLKMRHNPLETKEQREIDFMRTVLDRYDEIQEVSIGG